MQEMNWISVKDKLPVRRVNVLVYYPGYRGGRIDIGCLCSDGWTMEKWGKWGPVTHWMPLPEPPKEVCNHDQG